MIIYVVRDYLKFCDMGFFDPVLCEIDPDHGRLYTNIDDTDHVYLYCLGCDFKIRLGINSIQDMAKAVTYVTNYY